MAGRDLRPQVAFAFLRGAHIVEQHRQYIRIHRAPPHQFHRRDAHALLIDFAAKPHRAGISPAHIGMMRPRSNIEIGIHVARVLLPAKASGVQMFPAAGLASPNSALFHIHRRDQGDVGQMRAAAKRIVQHHHVAWLHGARINRGPHRHRHRPQMHWHVVAHRDHLSRAIENRAGVIATLLDIRRKCRTPQRRPHLLRDGVI